MRRSSAARDFAGGRAAEARFVVPRPLGEAVVVITGASSGIGRAAAVRFAREGASVVLAARGEHALADVASDCVTAGGRALVVAADVADEVAVERLAARAVERFGRIDVWVNNAGVILYGRFDQLPTTDFRRVIETTLFGQVYGARAALPRFRAQGGGVLINMSSVWGRVESPYVSAYVTAKFAVRAFSECLRFELADCPDVHVATMLPQAVDTPIFDHAANYTGRAVRPIPPLIDADTVAEGIVRCAASPKDEVTYGRSGRALELVRALAPSLYRRVAAGMFTDGTFSAAEQVPNSGNLFEPTGGRVSGGWRRERRDELLDALKGTIRGLARGLRG
jgi:NAD(P)-dependent dehydrogenase (short-subunit alcohol dehydrogenase family)